MLVGRILQNVPQPGALSGETFDATSLEGITATLIADGLKSTGRELKIESGFRPIALFLNQDNEEDHHFIRMDDDGTWSQKFANMTPESLSFGTFSGNRRPVLDPREICILFDWRIKLSAVWEEPTSPFHNSYKFAGFFSVPVDLCVPRSTIDKKLEKIAQRSKEEAVRSEKFFASSRLPNGSILVPQVA